MEDREVIKRIKAGSVDDFSILVEKYHRQLLNFLFRIVEDRTIAEDIGQEVFLCLYKSLDTFDEERGTPFSAWLFITARNAAISQIRRKKEQVSLDIMDHAGNEAGIEEQLERKEELPRLHASLACLGEPYRTTLLQSLQGKSINEIAFFDAVSAGTVKSRLHRAKRILFGLLNTAAKGG